MTSAEGDRQEMLSESSLGSSREADVALEKGLLGRGQLDH